MAAGHTRRALRLFNEESRRTVLLPIDQPVTLGPLAGLTPLARHLPDLLAGGPDGVIAHRGVLRTIQPMESRNIGLVMHLSAGTRLGGGGHVKTITAEVEDAIRAGADAVSVQVTFGVPEENAMLRDLTRVVSACERWGLPLLTMVYAHGGDPASLPARVAHAARVAAELGSDLVKVPYTGSADSFAAVVDGCFVPVVVAGGERTGDWEHLLLMVKTALSVGAAGACVGRNVFQHDEPIRAMQALRQLVHAYPREEQAR